MSLIDTQKQYGPMSMSGDNNLSLNTPGAKADQDKVDLDLVLGKFPRALEAVGKVGTFGAKKYSEDSWLSVHNGIRRYGSAMLRHYFKDSEGEYLDQETQLPHVAAVAWNSLARLELILLERERDET